MVSMGLTTRLYDFEGVNDQVEIPFSHSITLDDFDRIDITSLFRHRFLKIIVVQYLGNSLRNISIL